MHDCWLVTCSAFWSTEIVGVAANITATSLSFTSFCGIGSIKVPVADGHPYLHGCMACPAGETALGGVSRSCTDCAGVQCIAAGTSRFHAKVVAGDHLLTGDSFLVQVVAARGAAESAVTIDNTSMVLYDATPPATGTVVDTMPCACILPQSGFPTKTFADGTKYKTEIPNLEWNSVTTFLHTRP